MTRGSLLVAGDPDDKRRNWFDSNLTFGYFMWLKPETPRGGKLHRNNDNADLRFLINIWPVGTAYFSELVN